MNGFLIKSGMTKERLKMINEKMKAGAIKQIAIKRLSKIKNVYCPLSSFHYPLFAICYLLN